jgi:ankyrin repeat protein
MNFGADYEMAYDMAHSGDSSGVLNWLSAHEDNINVSVRDGYGLLHVACMFGHENLVRLLLDRMALVNLNADNASAATPLHLATSYREEAVADRVIRILVDNGAELSAKQNGGQTALHHAVARGSVLMVRTLIEAGADPFLEDDQKRSSSALAKELSEEDHGSEVRSVLATVFSLRS